MRHAAHAGYISFCRPFCSALVRATNKPPADPRDDARKCAGVLEPVLLHEDGCRRAHMKRPTPLRVRGNPKNLETKREREGALLTSIPQASALQAC